MGRGKAYPMRHIQRATVTGLFALWLAPLSAAAEAPGNAHLRVDRGVQAERPSLESRKGEDDDASEAETLARR